MTQRIDFHRLVHPKEETIKGMRRYPWQGSSCRQASLSDLGIPYFIVCRSFVSFDVHFAHFAQHSSTFFCLCLSLGSCIPSHLAATRRPHSAALGIWTIHLVCQVHRHLCRLALGSNSQEGFSQIFLATISYNPLEHSAPEAAFIPRTEDSAARSGFRFQNYREKKHKPPQMHLIHFETAAKCPFTVHDPSPTLWLHQQIAPYTQCLFSRLELWNAITKGRFSQQLKLTVSLCNSACLLYSKETLVQTPSCLSSYDKIQTAHAPAGASAADLSYT